MVISRIPPSPYVETNQIWIEEFRFGSVLLEERIRKGFELASEPVFVHDGPIGKKAWLDEVSMHGKPSRWIFVSRELVYERRAGETRDSTID